ncbi:MAG: thioredoxin family protein [Rhodobacteraceae bacterium]|nr:thioredoxin family protein [Paracoccaceae bacterium]
MVLTNTPICDFGQAAPDFDLPATDGSRVRLSDVRGKNGTLIMFICNHCPYVVSVLDRIVDDARLLQKEGVGVAAICSNDAYNYPQDSFDNMVRFAKNAGFSFPYLHDESQRVARAYGAVCTPDFFGYDSALGLQYRGRLDSAGKNHADSRTKRELIEAMSQIVATGRGPERQTPSMGCSIKWKR